MAVAPGGVTANVQGTRATPYDVTVKVRAFTEPEWKRVLDVIAAQLGRTAALLDGELPPELVDDVGLAGLDLLPGPHEVETRCSCPDFAEPCKHSSAVCYLVADVLDEDPFALLLMRGRERATVLAELRARRATSPDDDRAATDHEPVDEGLPARAAYAAEAAELPVPPMPPARPGRPMLADLAPPPSAGVDGEGLAVLATDAAVRAWKLATGDGDGDLTLPVEADVARRAAALLGQPALYDLASRAGMSSRQLTSHALAWRHAGTDGLRILTDDWRPDHGAMSAARNALTVVAPNTQVQVRGNRATSGRRQIRLGRDGRWYLLTKSFRGWDLAAPPADDPSALFGPG
ncbi:MAG: hypothetical protein GEU93_03425 [Propionibacteriales bacterium]|nr:hypothetical protein [Propionibacteriales bacterium]